MRPPFWQLPFHPVLQAVAPVLFLYARNAETFAPDVLLVPAGVSLACVGAAWLALAVVLGDVRRAAIPVTVGTAVWFVYGYARTLGIERGLGDGVDALLLPLWLCVVAVTTWATVRRLRDVALATRILNVVAAVFVASSAAQIAASALGPRAELRSPPDEATAAAARPGSGLPPNIVHIVLDEYGRADHLAQQLGFDNEPMLAFLRSRGFSVAERSHSNYAQTAMSIASTLNLDYLPKLFSNLPKGLVDRKPLGEAIRNARLFALLRANGYQIGSFASGFTHTEIDTADAYYRTGQTLSQFSGAALNLTPVAVVWRWLLRRDAKRFDLHQQHRDRLIYAFEHLPKSELREPWYLLAHLMAPHPPFVFDRNGPVEPDSSYSLRERVSVENYSASYPELLRYVNARLMETIDAILAREGRAPIIWLHSDHGTSVGWARLWLATDTWATDDPAILRERMGILNAVRLPPGDEGALYPTITPINTLRQILDRHLGTRLGLVEDRVWWSTYDSPFEFVDVTEVVAGD